jgi:hypothetical protein
MASLPARIAFAILRLKIVGQVRSTRPGTRLQMTVPARAKAAVADMPGANRIFVTFTDSSSTLRGETSVAVRTQ